MFTGKDVARWAKDAARTTPDVHAPVKLGDTVTTTVHMIGARSEEVSGPVVDLNMSRKTPGRVVAYVVDASESGYGRLVVPVADAR